jgi:hypothetical protein
MAEWYCAELETRVRNGIQVQFLIWALLE